jgi:hypothetical protein
MRAGEAVEGFAIMSLPPAHGEGSFLVAGQEGRTHGRPYELPP